MLRPLGMNVLIHRDQAEETVTDSGLVIPMSVQERPQTALVVSAGKGEQGMGAFIPMPVKEGDKILIGKYSGVDIEVGNRMLTIIQATDILGVFDE